jgi:hypothetical protein
VRQSATNLRIEREYLEGAGGLDRAVSPRIRASPTCLLLIRGAIWSAGEDASSVWQLYGARGPSVRDPFGSVKFGRERVVGENRQGGDDKTQSNG